MTPHPLADHKPHNCRRANFHNYKAPGTYMITISKHPDCPDFSYLSGDLFDTKKPPTTTCSYSGSIILNQIKSIEDWKFFSIRNFVIMPDHVHILWQVKDWLDRDIGYYIGLFKSRCTAQYRKGSQSSASELFLNKFNDRIAFNDKMAHRFHNYISDNPRRRLIAVRMPQLFQRMQCVRILDREFDLYGNFQLLKHPIITPAIISSKYTTTEQARLEAAWVETIRTGGVLISPFISPKEQALRNRAIAEGASIIRIIPDGLTSRYKPHGEEFELCAAGRCLHLGPPRASATRHELTRRECLEYNEIARWIASHPAEMMRILDARHRQ